LEEKYHAFLMIFLGRAFLGLTRCLAEHIFVESQPLRQKPDPDFDDQAVMIFFHGKLSEYSAVPPAFTYDE